MRHAVNMSETFDTTTSTDSSQLTTELVVRAPSAFEISTPDNVYMDQEIRTRITHIKTELENDTSLKQQDAALKQALAQCDAFLEAEDHRTWSALAEDVANSLSGASAEEQARIRAIVMADVITHRNQALAQHEGLVKAYQSAGLTVTRLPNHAGTDAVFATDTGEQIGDCFLLGNLKNPRRHGEERCTLDLLAKRHIPVKRIPNMIIEGGDLIYSPFYRVLFVGEGFRNTNQPAQKIAQAFPQIRVIPVGLTKAEHYHLDCCFMVLSGGEILVYKDAITPAAYDALVQLTQQRHSPAPLLLKQAEALSFGTNLVCVGEHVFHAAGSLRQETLDQVKAWGYECHSIPYDALHRSGGSIRCSTLVIRPKL